MNCAGSSSSTSDSVGLSSEEAVMAAQCPDRSVAIASVIDWSQGLIARVGGLRRNGITLAKIRDALIGVGLGSPLFGLDTPDHHRPASRRRAVTVPARCRRAHPPSLNGPTWPCCPRRRATSFRNTTVDPYAFGRIPGSRIAALFSVESLEIVGIVTTRRSPSEAQTGPPCKTPEPA